MDWTIFTGSGYEVLFTDEGVGDGTEEDGDGREITGSLESTMSAILARLSGVGVEVVEMVLVEVVLVEVEASL